MENKITKLTKLQAEFIDTLTKENDYICFPLSIFDSEEYKKFKKQKQLKKFKE